jgi:hypothetical protein
VLVVEVAFHRLPDREPVQLGLWGVYHCSRLGLGLRERQNVLAIGVCRIVGAA